MNEMYKFPTLLIVFPFLFITGMLTPHAVTQHELTIEQLETWLNGYEGAWETLNADKAAMLFTEDATYQENPYKDPFHGRAAIHDYWSAVTADQADVDFTYEVLSVTANKGIAHWHSEFVQPSTGNTVILDGIFVLEFSKAGLCQSLKEWWHFKSVPAG